MAVRVALPGTNVWIKLEQELTPIQLWLFAYRLHALYSAKDPEFPAKSWIFTQIVNYYWGPKSSKPFLWHPWAERMNEEVHDNTYLGVVGCASSGKSDFFSVYALVNWLSEPDGTLVLVTSTSLKDSKKRIWGALVSYYVAAGGDRGLPGRLVDSQGIIKTDFGTGTFDERCSINLIAGEKKKDAQNIGKLIGFKNKRVILIADELPELSFALVEAMMGNLSANPWHQMIGMGNLFSKFDPLGMFVEPSDGWDSVNENTEEWKTCKGHCLRFDGEKSPNVLEGRDIYPFLYNLKNYRDHKSALGEGSVTYWRMCRSFIPKVGAESTIYSEALLHTGEAHQTVKWVEPPARLAALDPGFTNGGDRSVAHLFELGEGINGIRTLQLVKTVHLVEDAGIKTPHNYQVARKFIDFCTKERVHPKNTALDVTGGGALFWEILCELWKNQDTLKVEFGGSASERSCYGLNGNKTCRDAYDRRVSELWYVGVDFVRGKQIKGISPSLAREMVSRHYDLVKGTSARIRVEQKKEVKKRLGFSPDEADAFMLGIELARARHNFTPAIIREQRRPGRDAPIKEWAKRMSDIYSRQYKNARP